MDTTTLWRAALILPSVLFVLAGLHWAGALLAIVLFALWCARLRRGLAVSRA